MLARQVKSGLAWVVRAKGRGIWARTWNRANKTLPFSTDRSQCGVLVALHYSLQWLDCLWNVLLWSSTTPAALAFGFCAIHVGHGLVFETPLGGLRIELPLRFDGDARPWGARTLVR